MIYQNNKILLEVRDLQAVYVDDDVRCQGKNACEHANSDPWFFSPWPLESLTLTAPIDRTARGIRRRVRPADARQMLDFALEPDARTDQQRVILPLPQSNP